MLLAPSQTAQATELDQPRTHRLLNSTAANMVTTVKVLIPTITSSTPTATPISTTTWTDAAGLDNCHNLKDL
jgi:hypothetical protein